MSTSKQNRLAGYGCEDVTSCGFVSLMDLYENNYMRMRRLVPNLSELPENAVSHLPGCLSLYIKILERTKFTTTLMLTYQFGEDKECVPEPALTIRIYHDVHQLEVLTGHLQHGRKHYNHIPEKAIKIKWKLNRFLFKWLGYCLYLGHLFPVTDSAPIPAQNQLHNLIDIIRRTPPKNS